MPESTGVFLCAVIDAPLYAVREQRAAACWSSVDLRARQQRRGCCVVRLIYSLVTITDNIHKHHSVYIPEDATPHPATDVDSNLWRGKWSLHLGDSPHDLPPRLCSVDPRLTSTHWTISTPGRRLDCGVSPAAAAEAALSLCLARLLLFMPKVYNTDKISLQAQTSQNNLLTLWDLFVFMSHKR